MSRYNHKIEQVGHFLPQIWIPCSERERQIEKDLPDVMELICWEDIVDESEFCPVMRWQAYLEIEEAWTLWRPYVGWRSLSWSVMQNLTEIGSIPIPEMTLFWHTTSSFCFLVLALGMRNEDFCDVKKFRAHLSLLLSISPEFARDKRCHRRKIYYKKCVGIF